jgi:hypothetical protein
MSQAGSVLTVHDRPDGSGEETSMDDEAWYLRMILSGLAMVRERSYSIDKKR